MKFALPAFLLLAGCGGRDTAQETQADGAAVVPEDDRFACAVGGAETLAPVCTFDRTSSPDGTTLTLRHPDGGFRRLLVTSDGRGVIAADGADPALVTVVGAQEIEVSLAGDRYRLPATLRGQ
jgi:hypothetical protein